MSNPLLDKDFLLKLDQQKERENFARIISLDFDENPLEQIEGRVTGGSVNIDGTSAVRRSCSLSMVAENLDINNFYWGVKNKFKLEIGLSNKIDSNYPDVIWFPLGMYVITSFSTSYTTNSYTISISGKDKMCLLNGELGGSLPSQVDFGYEEYWDKTNNVITKTPIPIKTIIREAIHTYGNEPFSNIVINDLEDSGLELMEYRGNDPMYVFYKVSQQQYDNFTINGNGECKIKDSGIICPISKIEENGGHYDKRMDLAQDLTEIVEEASIVNFRLGDSEEYNSEDYTISKVEFGDTPGYKITDLIYAGELIGNVGETITSILDKIKNMLGEFEYFYDLDGRFIFQRKKTYVNTTWNNIISSKDEEYVNTASQSSSVIYNFEDNNLITAFSNTPTLNNLKNDYAIWGSRKTTSGTELPVHYRCAIDRKPTYYRAFNKKIFVANKELYNLIYEKVRRELYEEIMEAAQNFRPKYQAENIWQNLIPSPQRQIDGGWGPGWWDIRDWYDYYTLLTQTDPNATMKWYSYNGKEGCTKIGNYYTWLITMLKYNNGWEINFNHGYSTSYGKIPVECTKYVSSLDDNGSLVTTKTDEKKVFVEPFNQCNDEHTFLYFLKQIETYDCKTYFYNPQFPQGSSFDEIIDAILKERLKNTLFLVDWRELIYQMALDFYQYGHNDDYSINIIRNNMKIYEDSDGCYYPTGRTGYEQYYADLQGFWRQLYDLDPTNKEDYFLEGDNIHWNKNIQNSPELLNFWFDFIDENNSELGKYSVKSIGDRAKSINDSDVTAIYFREVPNIIFTTADEYVNSEVKDKTGYIPVLITSGMESLFSISAQGKSAKDAFDELLYNYSYCVENISLTSLPIYYLYPNSRIKVIDKNTNINGEYLVSKITLPLTYNGTMNITATKAPERLN